MHKEMKEQANKRAPRKVAREKRGIGSFLKHFNSLSVNVYSIIEIKTSDFKEGESSLRQSEEAFEIASKKPHDSVQGVVQLQTKRTDLVKGRPNIDIFVSCMEKSVRLIDSLKIPVDDMCSFWKHLEQCCTTVAKETDLAL